MTMMVVFSAGFLASFSAFFNIPETNGREMLDDVEEAEKFLGGKETKKSVKV